MSQERNNKYVTFTVLPYLNLKKSIKVGDVTFWPFYEEYEQRVTDKNIKSRLKRIFSCYVSSCGTTLDHYLSLTKDEKDKLKEWFAKVKISEQIEAILTEIPIYPQCALYDPNEEITCLERLINNPENHTDIDRNKVRIAIEKLRNLSVEVILPPVLDPIESIAIASIGDKPHIEGLTDDNFNITTELIRTAVNTLFFACLEKSLWYQSRSHSSAGCTSDNFQVYYQNVKQTDNDEFFAISDGFWWGITNVVSCDSTRITTPPYVPSHYVPDYDPNLVEFLIKASTTDTPECRRIIRSIPSLYRAIRNSPLDIDYNTRILLLAQAFEILLDIEDRGKTEDFRNKIHSILGNESEAIVEYISCNYHKATEGLTEKQRWAHQFYKLRSDIIHGEEVTNENHHYINNNNISGDHFSIALQFFIISVEKVLEKANIGYYCPHYFEVTTNTKKDDNGDEEYTEPFTIKYGKLKLDKELKQAYKDIFSNEHKSDDSPPAKAR